MYKCNRFLHVLPLQSEYVDTYYINILTSWCGRVLYPTLTGVVRQCDIRQHYGVLLFSLNYARLKLLKNLLSGMYVGYPMMNIFTFIQKNQVFLN